MVLVQEPPTHNRWHDVAWTFNIKQYVAVLPTQSGKVTTMCFFCFAHFSIMAHRYHERSNQASANRAQANTKLETSTV